MAGRGSYSYGSEGPATAVAEQPQPLSADKKKPVLVTGADSRSRFPFLHSKGVAQDSIKTSGLRWTVLRPSVIFGPEDQFVNVLGRLIKLTPKIFPLPDGGKARFQPIAVDDVARVVRLS